MSNDIAKILKAELRKIPRRIRNAEKRRARKIGRTLKGTPPQDELLCA